ncbi:MAG: phosphatase PAP2 family protein [Armatimonadota bacterium]|nr:phosphatase PAP2 family protein [Armatimonadota bacterium]
MEKRLAVHWPRNCVILVVMLACTGPARSDDNSLARTATNSLGPFLVLGEASLLLNGENGTQQAWQGAQALLTTAAATEALKRIVREKRPHSDERTSFPSGHASLSFAMATTLAEYKPRYKWLGYGVASTIAWSRVEKGAHRWHDVIAGAALGHFIARRFTRHHIGLTSQGLAFHKEW